MASLLLLLSACLLSVSSPPYWIQLLSYYATCGPFPVHHGALAAHFTSIKAQCFLQGLEGSLIPLSWAHLIYMPATALLWPDNIRTRSVIYKLLQVRACNFLFAGQVDESSCWRSIAIALVTQIRLSPTGFGEMETTPVEIGSSKMFDGYNKRYKHYSPTLACSMTFHIFFPSSPDSSNNFPVLYWLSGLTCTDENFIIKSGAQRAAAAEKVALVAPDTSPRGLNVEGESDSWDFGIGAGFYLNATQEKWKSWRMYDYVVKELPELLAANFPQLDTSRASISGHSMGGHGALTIYLKNLNKYKSVSAFAPISNPINCPWGQKAFTNYLGDNKAEWEEYDATCLVKKFHDVSATILIDQGGDDKFLHDQLLPGKFEEACRSVGTPLLLRLHPGYDHSYYFIATFIDDHICHHAQALRL